MPATHDGFDLAGCVVLIPEAGKNRNRTEIPSGARAVAAAAGVGLQMNSIDGARELGVDLRNKARPVAAVVEGIGHDVITQLAQHHGELNHRGCVEAVLIVEVDRIKSGDGGFQGLKILVENAGGAGALRFDESGYVLPVSDVRGADAERDAFHRALFELGHFGGKVWIGLVADVDSAGGQGELTVEIQVAGAVDFDAPDDGFGESGVFDLGDVG